MRGTNNKRCSICGARIPNTQSLCDICESTYPCHECTNKDKTVCMCKRWKRWFHLHWSRFSRKSEN